jgi:D-3-phosphoglycerate dehydrogenase
MAGTQAKDIASKDRPNHAGRSLSVSTSPTATFHSPSQSYSFGGRRASTEPKQLKPFDKTDMKILLLENINESGRDILSNQNYQVESLKTSLPEDQLIEKIR